MAMMYSTVTGFCVSHHEVPEAPCSSGTTSGMMQMPRKKSLLSCALLNHENSLPPYHTGRGMHSDDAGTEDFYCTDEEDCDTWSDASSQGSHTQPIPIPSPRVSSRTYRALERAKACLREAQHRAAVACEEQERNAGGHC